ncbi:MAG: glycosyl transferase [Gammaproteobacteria bacterium]|nr:glycosyl transferase [Gammaproteobacteria bacterium]|tara:strand:+ start:68 stop:679 length:612 start_codon:yes stop_codon:yes gene_type:complete
MPYTILVLVLAFTSGFVIMSVELLGGKIMAPYFGSSIYVWGSIITVFMVSLSVGYLTGGRLSVRNPHLTKYGLFFIAGSITLIPLVAAGDAMMELVFMNLEDPRYGSLVAAGLLFFVPTAVLGMIAPYSVRLLVDNRETSGQVAGSLYFISTLGSALGTLATSFYFVLWFDLNVIIMSLQAALATGGVVAIVAGRMELGDARR